MMACSQKLTCVEAGCSNCNVIESDISIGALSPHSCHLHVEPGAKHVPFVYLENYSCLSLCERQQEFNSSTYKWVKYSKLLQILEMKTAISLFLIINLKYVLILDLFAMTVKVWCYCCLRTAFVLTWKINEMEILQSLKWKKMVWNEEKKLSKVEW